MPARFSMARIPTMIDDLQVRREAVESPQSILLQAPAGSGKTTVLVQRLLARLAEVERPEQVLAVTFTRKAAAEMRERVLKALAIAEGNESLGAAASDSERQTVVLAQRALDHGRRQGWNLADNPSRLRIQTVDALNRWMAAQLPVHAAMPSGETTDRPMMLYRDAARLALLDAAADPAHAVAFERLLHLANNRWQALELQLAQLLAARNRWLGHLIGEAGNALPERVERTLARAIQAELQRAAEWLGADFLERAAPVLHETARARAAVQSLDRDWMSWTSGADQPSATISDVPRWRCLARFLLLSDGKALRREFRASKGVPAIATPRREEGRELLAELAERDGALVLLQRLARLPDGLLADTQRAALTALSEFLPLAAAHVHAEMIRQGLSDHVAVAGAARAALVADQSPTELALRLGESLRHLLVDEFQDTSSEQFDLLTGLVSEWAPGDGRSLFAVGDPMQSIYRFRDADVALFLRARYRGVGALRMNALQLSANFRSAPTLVAAVNRQFAQLMPAIDDPAKGRAAFRPSMAARGEDPCARVEYHLLALDEAAKPPELERRRIVEIVRRIRQTSVDSRIAVLAQARPQMAGLVQALRAAGHAPRGVNLVPLAEVPVVQDLMGLTRALLDPMDRIAWLAVLRAPWCGATLDVLDALAQRAGDDTVVGVLQSEDFLHTGGAAVPRLRETAKHLLDGYARVPELGLARSVEATWRLLGGPQAIGEGGALADACRYLERLDQLSGSREWRGASSVAALVEDLYADPGPVTGLDIMTIHETKGLEFDHVIVAGLGHKLARDKVDMINWLEIPAAEDTRPGLLMAVRSPRGSDADDGGLYDWINHEHRQRARDERLRLMYVAATRAKQTLHWVASLHRKPDGEFSAPRTDSVLHLLWPAMHQEFIDSAAIERVPSVDEPPARRLHGLGRQLRRLPADFRIEELRRIDTRVRLAYRADPAEEPPFRWAGLESRHLGTVLHATLQRVAEQARRDGCLPEPFQDPLWVGELRRLGVGTARMPAALQSLARALAATLQDPRGRWILDPAHPAAHCEMPLTGLVGAQVVSAIIDRYLVAADGTHWIIDYKSGRHEGSHLEDFLHNERERYRRQMETYCTLVRAGQESTTRVRAALYFPLLQQFVSYD
jgi:ATP-dependent exoDNAse (exonuclease V) beta subunit